MLNKLIASLLLLVSFNTLANWTLNNDSSKVSFVSVKSDLIGEVHHFKHLSGTISKSGKFSLAINLASVETHIPLRNERMKTMLFNTQLFPTLTLNADVGEQLQSLKKGESNVYSVPTTLTLNGVEKSLNVDVFAAITSDGSLLLSAMQPLLINAYEFNLSDGVKALQKVAGLPNIAQSVPVTFVLHFSK